MDERLKKQLAFALEIDQEKNILRQTHLSGHGRNENDAEHAWHMAIMAYLLREYANEEVDIGRVMLMCLIHDIVEIDAGDTYAYDDAGLATQKAREDAAKERIYSLLPEDQKNELIDLFDEFEAYQTPESKFAHSMDNLQPLLLNDSNGGGDWREHKVSADKVYGRQSKTRMGSETLYHVTDQIIQKHILAGNLRTGENQAPAGQKESEKTAPAEKAVMPENHPCGDTAGETETAFSRLVDTVARLRAPDGCPWDRAQTHESLKPACVEEAAEVLCGINILKQTGNPQSLCEELGDLLLQVLMHASIAEEEGLFTLKDVIQGIDRKMIRRHPHVFGDRSLQLLAEMSGRTASAENTIKNTGSHGNRQQKPEQETEEQGLVEPGISMPDAEKTQQKLLADWKQIKSLEKQGREWEEPYLFQAFEEAEQLIGVARRRKEQKK